MWSNDYPHDEGTFLRKESGVETIRAMLSPAEAEAILRGNAARVYGFDLARLSQVVGNSNGAVAGANAS